MVSTPQTSALKNSAVAFNIVGTVGQTEVVTPGKIYTVSFVVTNTANQSVTRTLRIQVLPQNDGIRNPITAVTTGTYVNDTSNLAQAEKIRFGKPLRLLTQILPLQRILNLIRFHHLVW